MADVTREKIMAALGNVRKAEGGADVVSLGMITGVVIRDGNVGFAIEVEASEGAASEPLRQACEAAIEALPGGPYCAGGGATGRSARRWAVAACPAATS